MIAFGESQLASPLTDHEQRGEFRCSCVNFCNKGRFWTMFRHLSSACYLKRDAANALILSPSDNGGTRLFALTNQAAASCRWRRRRPAHPGAPAIRDLRWRTILLMGLLTVDK